MKNVLKISLLAFITHLFPSYSIAQINYYYPTDYNHFKLSHDPINPVCKGDTIVFKIFTSDNYEYYGYNNCGNFLTIDINFKGPDIVSVEDLYSPNDKCIRMHLITIKLLPKKTSSYEYSFTNSVKYIPAIQTRMGLLSSENSPAAGSFTIQVLNPPKPTVTADKSVADVYDLVTFTPHGCAAYSPEIKPTIAIYEAACDKNQFNWFDNSGGLDYAEQVSFVRRSFTPTNNYYKVRCTLGGCVGEYSEPISVRWIEKPTVPSPNCNQGEVDEAGYFPNRRDFHRYKLAQEICNKSTDPDCTVENVFNLLKSQQYYSVPQYKDFTDLESGTATGLVGGITGYNPILGGILIGAIASSGYDIDKSQRETPVSNCQQTGVYSPTSYLFWGKAFIPGIPPSNNGYFWDPITQGVDNSSHTITNFTLPGHTLHPGKVMITIKQDDCSVYAQVVGMGNSNLYDTFEPLGTFLSTDVNVNVGKSAFTNLLNRLKAYYDSKSWK